MRKIARIAIFILVFLMSITALRTVFAMTRVSDQILSSAPGVGSDHLISFLAVENIPPSGRIEIVPEAGKFFIPNGFDYTDVDLATSFAPSGPFSNRDLGAVPSNTDDGISVLANTSSGKIDITLNSSFGIPADTYVLIRMGSTTSYGVQGDKQIVSPPVTGSYRIFISSYDENGQFLKKAQAMVSIVNPVKMSGAPEKRRMNGAPIGWLTFGTGSTILSMITNYEAHCRFSLASGTPYAAMTDSFTYAESQYSYYHTAEIGGLTSGQTYNYYVRCVDTVGGKDYETNCDYIASTTPYMDAEDNPITTLKCVDYWIPFYISGQAGTEGNTSGSGSGGTNPASTGTGGGSGSSSGTSGAGGGSGGGTGNERGSSRGKKYLPYPPLPGAPGVVFTGWAYPNSEITVLKDGQEAGFMLASQQAAFGGFLENMVKGVFTFTLWSEDLLKRRSANYSTTFYIDSGTQTTVANVIIPPTISINLTSFENGTPLEVSGITAPKGKVEVWLSPKKEGKINDTEIVKLESPANNTGQWNISFVTTNLVSGEYYVKARTALKEGIDKSGFSQSLPLNIGQSVQQDTGTCAGADLNRDGKVNITDFSILLYYWGSNNACADQNKNGKVEIADFSIMMYYWTG